MKRTPWLTVFVVVIAVGLFAVRQWKGSGNVIKYRGETFRLSKRFFSYGDYKDAPNNLDTQELARIEQLMTESPMPVSFPTQNEFGRAALKFKFPGYGFSGRGSYPQADGSTCVVFSVEIPMRDKERYFVGRSFSGPLSVVDDFVLSLTTNELKQVKIDGTHLRYFDRHGSLLRDKEVSQ